MNAKELLTSPLSALTTVAAFLAHLAGFVDIVIQAVWTTVPTWFPALSIAGSTLLPTLGEVALPIVGTVDVGALGSSIIPVGALIYVAYLGDKTVDKLTDDEIQEK